MSVVLNRIDSPADLKKLSLKELNQLASEIRELIIDVTSRKGGHLAPSLGVVEMTIALHYVFNAPFDKILWDVGHQCYAHKILTGRRENFKQIRDYKGLSGFPKREESLYDVFGVGHSSTSLSAALGIAQGRDLRKENFYVVDVIGDGALTGGIALEALNYAGEIKTDLLVILNDNEMSIGHNIGGLPSYLAKLRTDPTYYRLKEDLEYVLERIPAIGKTMLRSAERIKDSLKYLLVSGMLFEELGFTYLGPVDGHSIPKLVALFREVKSVRGPVLLHVVTKKGKGYPPAEKKPCTFHGVGPFDKKTGEPLSGSKDRPTYSGVFGSALEEYAEEDPSIVAITAAMAVGTGLENFARRWPERFFDVGIAEQHAVTMAAGLAVEGFKPVAAIYSTFLQRAYDQLLHDVCLQKLPVVFAVDRAGLVGEDGETHNGLYDLAYLRNLPNLTLMAPADGRELKAMLKMALEMKCPAAIRYPRGPADRFLTEETSKLKPGKAQLLTKGRDLLILAVGSMVVPALKAHEILLKMKIESSVINPRFVQPLDKEMICCWAEKCGRVITVEEHILGGGFGSAILEMLADEGIQGVHLKRLGFISPYTGQGKRDFLLERHGLSAEKIADEAYRFCQVQEKVY
ncbi:MAG: 1-deoxy-D-xylulose-5-phosphate synthase [Firmicutes bacterium]|nr:1-deoxy-D-xylulose-5-phosphate synthase [Bacillota bacterium]